MPCSRFIVRLLNLFPILPGRLHFGWQHPHSGPAQGRQAHRRGTHLSRPKSQLSCDSMLSPQKCILIVGDPRRGRYRRISVLADRARFPCPFYFKTATKDQMSFGCKRDPLPLYQMILFSKYELFKTTIMKTMNDDDDIYTCI